MTYLSRYSNNKYGAKKTEYNGRSYMSKFEARVAQDLDLEMKAGIYTEIISQFPIKLYVYLPDGSKAYIFKYICDFRCTKADGSYKLVEAKGHLTETYKTKLKILDLIWLPDHLDYEFEEIRQ